jgi:diguanylate cyclase (GGDEF)-like protein
VDIVTGVASQAQTKAHLREALAAFTERQIAFGVLHIRLQGLEHFRAAFGPDAASSLLRVVALSLASDLWRTDIVGRWADDEFLVILNGCREESLPVVRERLRRMLANDSIEWWGERRSLRVSAGQATPQPGDTAESILDRSRKSLDQESQWLTRATAAAKKPSSGS